MASDKGQTCNDAISFESDCFCDILYDPIRSYRAFQSGFSNFVRVCFRKTFDFILHSGIFRTFKFEKVPFVINCRCLWTFVKPAPVSCDVGHGFMRSSRVACSVIAWHFQACMDRVWRKNQSGLRYGLPPVYRWFYRLQRSAQLAGDYPGEKSRMNDTITSGARAIAA